MVGYHLNFTSVSGKLSQKRNCPCELAAIVFTTCILLKEDWVKAFRGQENVQERWRGTAVEDKNMKVS